ncbi:hypothetical protein FJZ17_03620 [Candidatus Pacearchaeota archaeon]|nr:hypothetical protein [Candidatus Pacearchaeota archaeon]
MKSMKNKKAGTTLLEQVIFYVLNVFFVLSLMLFVNNVSSGSLITEERYAKTFGLTIDSLKEGTEVNISLIELYNLANKNKYLGEVVIIKDNLVRVQVSKAGGYEFQFITLANKISYEVDKSKKGGEFLILRMK